MLRVKELREAKGWNQTILAYHAGLSPSQVSLIETGKRNPSATTLKGIADALGVEVGDLFPKAQAPPPLDEYGEDRRRGYVAVGDLLEDWRYLIEQSAERHLENVSSNLFETAEGAAAYSIAAYTETAQLFEIYLERLSPTIHNLLPEALAKIEGAKLLHAMGRLEEAQDAIEEAAKAAGVSLGHEQALSEAELAVIDEAAREFEALPELEQRRQMRQALEILDRIAEERIVDARRSADDIRRQSSA